MSKNYSNRPLPPFLRILIPFAAGICWQWYYGSNIVENSIVLLTENEEIVLASGLLILLFCIFYRRFWLRWRLKEKHRLIRIILFVVIQFCGFFIWGALLCKRADIRSNVAAFEFSDRHIGYSKNNNIALFNDRKHTAKRAADKLWLLLQVVERPLSKPDFYRFECRLIACGKEELIGSVPINMIVYMRKSDGVYPPEYGQRFLLHAHPQPIAEPGNPGAFDYKTYAARKGIFYQIWAPPSKIKVVQGFYGSKWQEWVYLIRDKILQSLRKNIADPDAAGIAEALLVGYRYGIDADLNEAYTKTGVVHIIAISGMHLSMLFGLLALIPISRKNPYFYGLKILFVLAVIWFFTILAGAAPSILRASIMFTISLAAPFVLRRNDPLNTLLATAFILLVIDPMYLWDIGFQLSFTAVAGLLIFLQPITAFFKPQHPLLSILWQMQAVSIAAQLLTTPLVLYHFNQFPVLFLLTNLIAIPLSGLVLYVEVIYCLCIWSSFLTSIIAKPIEWLLQYMNYYIVTLSSFSFCVYYPIYLSKLQVILLYIGVLGGSLYLVSQKFKWLLMLNSSMLLFMAARSFDLIKANRHHKLIVYQLKNSTYAEIIRGRSAYYWNVQCAIAGLDTGFAADTTRSFIIRKRAMLGFDPKHTLDIVIPTEYISKQIQPTHVSWRIHQSILHAVNTFEAALPNLWLLPIYKSNRVVIGWWNQWYNNLLGRKDLQLSGLLSIAIVSHGPPPFYDDILKSKEIIKLHGLPHLFVLSTTVSYRDAQLWQQFATIQSCSIHDVSTQGAFIWDLH